MQCGLGKPRTVPSKILSWDKPDHLGTSLVPRPSAWGEEEGLVHTACACALISRNSVARADFSVLVLSRLNTYPDTYLPVYSMKTGRVHCVVTSLFSVCSSRLCR